MLTNIPEYPYCEADPPKNALVRFSLMCCVSSCFMHVLTLSIVSLHFERSLRRDRLYYSSVYSQNYIIFLCHMLTCQYSTGPPRRHHLCACAWVVPTWWALLPLVMCSYPHKLAGQFCRAILPGNFAGQFCRAILPGNFAGQFCRAILSGNFAG